MKSNRWLRALAIGTLSLCTSFALAQGEGHGNGRGHNKHDDQGDEDRGRGDHRGRDDGDHGDKERGYEKHGDREHGRGHRGYDDHDRRLMHVWYDEHREHLPRGLAYRDRLPPGLERQLEMRGTLPPGLRSRIYVVPVELERELPPPPPECEHALIGGHIVLLNRRTFLVVDVFHLQF